VVKLCLYFYKLASPNLDRLEPKGFFDRRSALQGNYRIKGIVFDSSDRI